MNIHSVGRNYDFASFFSYKPYIGALVNLVRKAHISISPRKFLYRRSRHFAILDISIIPHNS